MWRAGRPVFEQRRGVSVNTRQILNRAYVKTATACTALTEPESQSFFTIGAEESGRIDRVAARCTWMYHCCVHAFDLGPAPLVEDNYGVLRVARTRVTLDSIVAAFDLGATPEEIVQRYPSIDLASTYAVIAYVLGHRESVDAYLAERIRSAAKTQADVEARFPPRWREGAFAGSSNLGAMIRLAADEDFNHDVGPRAAARPPQTRHRQCSGRRL